MLGSVLQLPPRPCKFALVDGAVLETFSIDFAAGQAEFDLRRHVPIPNDDGLANLVVFFQLLVEDGAVGWVVSSIKGTAVRLRRVEGTAAATGGGSAQSLSPADHEQHCRQLAHAADRATARQWLFHRDPQARAKFVQLRTAIGP